MTHRTRTRHAAVIAALLLAAPAALPVQAGPLQVDASPIYLNPENIGQADLGKLRFVTGLRLVSADRTFGGLSGHTLLSDGRGWLAVSDEGRWLSGTLTFDARGAVTGIADVAISPLNGPDGKPLPRTSDKRFIDSEAIRQADNGDLLVSFEGAHRILRYPAAAGLTGVPTPMTPPREIDDGPRNGGMEAIAPLPDGRILVLTEDMRDADKLRVGWLIEDGQWKGLRLRPTGIFKPTDMAAMPNGDVMLLERRYTPSGGPGARLSVLKARTIKAGALLEGLTLAEMALPLSVDNYEALALRADGAGGWDVFVLSDDNFNPLQRTLLLQFHLPKEAIPE